MENNLSNNWVEIRSLFQFDKHNKINYTLSENTKNSLRNY